MVCGNCEACPYGWLMGSAVAWMEQKQIPLYLAAILVGVLGGSISPSLAPDLAITVTPLLGLLLFATFLGIPFIEVGRAFRDTRFFASMLVLNFVVVPLVVWGLSRFVAGDQALLLGVLLVLLTPCVDYVIVFTGLASGAKDRLLAATPLLMLLQIVLLPVYLLLFAGPGAVALIEVDPFVEAFLILIVIPLTLAGIVQALAKKYLAARAMQRLMHALMVPLVMATLAVVIGSQISGIGNRIGQLITVVPLYVAFLVVMLFIGLFVGRVARLDVPRTRALVFSGATRNSLVVLPLALALPASLSIVPLVVVTQTLVELVGMILFVRLVPRLTTRRR